MCAKKLVVWGILVLATLNVVGAERQWTGGANNNDWYDAGNWSPAGTPNPGDTLSLAGGSPIISPPFILTGTFHWTNGTLSGGLVAAGGAVVNWHEGTLTGGAALTVASNGVLNLLGPSSKLLYGPLTNRGTIHWLGGPFYTDYYPANGIYGEIWNEAGGIFTLQGDNTLSCNNCWQAITVHNAGTLLKINATETSTISAHLDNTGTVRAQTGTLNFLGGGQMTGGIYEAAAGAKVYFGGGSFVVNGALDWRGPGEVGVTGGSWSGSFSGTLNWYAGTLAYGNAPLTVASNGVLNLVGPDYKLLYGPLTNRGTIRWVGGTLYMDYHPGNNVYGEIWNAGGGVFAIQGDDTLTCNNCWQPITVHNAGTLLKTNATGISTISASLDNTGTVRAQTGTLNFVGGGQMTGGIYEAAAGAKVYFSSGSFVVNGALDWRGPGEVGVTGGSWSGSFSGTLNWYAGTLAYGNAPLTVASNGVLNLVGPDYKLLYGPLTNRGTIRWVGGTLYMDYHPGNNVYGEIWNAGGGVFAIQGDDTLTCNNCWQPITVHNAGTLLKTNATGISTISASLDNTGTVRAQTGTLNFVGGGQMTGGIYEAAAGAKVYFSSGSFVVNGALDWRGPGEVGVTGGSWSGSFSGTLNWYAGTLTYGNAPMTVASNGVLNLAGPGSKLLYGPLTNRGTIRWLGGTLYMDYYPGINYYGEIWNEAGGVISIEGDNALSCNSCWQPITLHNGGTLLKTNATGDTTIAAYFENSGTVAVQSGTLSFQNGGQLSGGIYQAAAGARAYFGAGTFTVNGAVDWRGPGEVRITGGQVELVNLVGALDLHGGVLTGQGVLHGTLNWYSGQLGPGGSLTVASNGAINLAGPGSKLLYGPLTNRGTIRWLGGTLYMDYYPGINYYGEIWNEAGGVISIEGDNALSCNSCWQPITLHNGGTLLKTNATGDTTIAAYFENSGTVAVQSGTLSFQNGGQLSGGIYQAAAGARAYFGAGTFTVNGAVDWRGPGEVRITGGQVELVNLVGALDLHGGVLTGQGVLHGTLNWYSGQLGPGGSLTVASNGVLNLAGPGSKLLYGPLTNRGTIRWLSGTLYMDYYPGINFYGEIWNEAGGVISIEGDNALSCNSCWQPITLHNGGTLLKTNATGDTTIAAYFENSGTVVAQSGMLNFQGGANLMSGVLDVFLNSPQDYGHIQFLQAQILGGQFFAMLNEGFVPGAGNSFTPVLSGNPSSGTFTTVTLPGAANWTSNYGLNAFTITATVILAPVITMHPHPQAVPGGANVVFAVAATSATPLTYRWRRNGAYLPGATNATLSLSNVQLSDNATYDVDVTNPFGLARSEPARLAVHTCGGFLPGLISYWPADGHSLDLVSGQHGSLRNGATYATGVSGQAFLLSDAYVAVPDSPLLNPASELTVSAWIYREADNHGYDPILKKAGLGGAQAGGYALEFSGNNLVWWIYAANGWQASDSLPVTLGTWTHVAGVYDGSTLRLYVNGVGSNPTSAYGSVASSTNPLHLGHDPSNPSRFFRGLIDEAAIFSRALSSNEISTLFRSGLCTTNLAAVPPFIFALPSSRTNAVGTLATFSVQASGSPPPTYQWRVNGTNLADGGRIIGAHAATLAITGVQLSDAGGYSVVVSNAAGSTNSVVAQLVVDDTRPVISQITVTTGMTTCTISWTTDEPTTHFVDYGTNTSYGFSAGASGPLQTNHVVTLAELTPETVHHFRVRSADAVGNESVSADGTFTTLPAPDLRIVELSASGPPVLQSGDTVRVRWITTNAGRAAVTIGTYESFQIAQTGPFSLGTGFAIDPLPPGEARTNTYEFRLYDGPLGAGDFLIVVVADAYNAVVEYLPDLNAETNNTATIMFTSTLRPYPDLAVTNLMAPTNVVPGQTIPVVWTLANEGDAAPSRPWLMEVHLSRDEAWGGDTLLSSVDGPTNLPPGSSLLWTQAVTIPLSASGPFWLLAGADTGLALYEPEKTDNVTGRPITVITPDLQVASISSPAAVQFGETITVSVAITNAGDASATAAWTDRIYFGRVQDSLTGAVLLASIPVGTNAPLAAGSIYSYEVQVTLPLGGSMELGGYFLLVSTDHTDAQPEFDESNNLSSIPIDLSLPPLPDLAVTAVAAPASAQAGQAIFLSWGVTNQGPLPARGPWSESILYSNAANGLQSLVLLMFTNDLAAGGAVLRTQAVTLPIAGPAGDLRFFVETDSRREVFEAEEANNRVAAANMTVLPHQLTLHLPLEQVVEDAPEPVSRATVTRNGSRAQDLSVWITNSDPTELSAPTNVVIAAGQASAGFDIRVLPDALVDGPQNVTLTAAAAGFVSGVGQITVLDSDLPRLSLVLVTNQVREGLTVAATITRGFATASPVVVALASSNPYQLFTPDEVVIPANSNAVTFAVLSVDDTLIEPALSYTVSATAAGYLSGSATVSVLDDDVPQIAINLANHVVPESAGPQATIGTVTRSPVTDRAVTIELSSSDTTAALVPGAITIPANQASASFSVAVVDDAVVDGSQSAVIGGYVLASGSSTRVASVPADTLTVTDDDGPALRLALGRTLVGEGLHPATTLTVTRAVPGATDLLVSLSSSDTTEATVPPSVVIPGNQLSASVTVDTVADGTNDGNQTVVLSASATDHAPAATVLVVSDVNLPDLFVPEVIIPATGETETYINVAYRVDNQGFASASNFTTRIFLSRDPLPGDDTLVGQFPFNGTLAPGQHFGQTLQVRLPQTAGDYWAVVCTDVGETVAEVLEANNCGVSASPIIVQAGYGGYVSAAIESGPNGLPVPLSGRTTNTAGAPAAYKLVNIHILVRGTERIVSALSDANGNFSASFQPLPTEAGRYEIFATHPGVSRVPVQDTFTLSGMIVRPAARAVDVIEQSSTPGAVTLENLGDVLLTGLSASVVGKPAPLNVTITLSTNQLGAMGSVVLAYEVAAPGPTGSGNIDIQITSTEGATATLRLAATVEPLRPRLAANPPQLAAGMVPGRQAVVEFDVINQGGLASGPVTVSLPAAPWLQLASTNPLPSLAPGESNRVTLLLTPPADLPLGPYTGTLALNAAQNSLGLSFTFRAFSEAKGDLRITAVDEFTFYADGAPRLAGATVAVRDPYDRSVVTNGVTGTNGQFRAQSLAEGYYELEITADRHTSYRNYMRVQAGVTNEVEAFLSRQTVQYTWTVVPTTIEDQYRIVVETVFETVVPVPVITIEPSVVELDDFVGEVNQVEMKISNHGLVAAQDVQFTVPTVADWEITALITNIGVLPANSSLSIPVTFRRLPAPVGLGSGGAIPPENIDPNPCSPRGALIWFLRCGSLYNQYNQYWTARRGRCFPGWGSPSDSSGGNRPCDGCPEPENRFVQEPPRIGPSPGDCSVLDVPMARAAAPAAAIHLAPAVGSPSGEICARVRLRLDQAAVLSRDAFKATLEISNASGDMLEDVGVEVVTRNGLGALATNVLGVGAPSLQNINAVDGTGLLADGVTASAIWILIPTQDAAPDGPVKYSVGGTLRYRQGGSVVTIPLVPAAITVFPNPKLFIKYFHQRDVYADDPFTDVVEPSVPFNLAVMIENRGKGDARNFRITSAQPRIIENEKGLLVDFQIIGTEVAGQSVTPSLTAAFGTITNGQRAIGRWLLTSTLQGLFTGYSASFEHVDSLGNPRLSLVEEVTIHEMNRLVQAAGAFEDGRPDFLVNDVPDAEDLPDTLYLSDGTTNEVSVVRTAAVDAPPSPSHLQVQLTAPMPAGWVYLRAPEPGAGMLRLTRVMRSDGIEISVGTNAWTTDRTFIGQGRRPIDEDVLHLLDFNSPGAYTLYYEEPPVPDTSAPSSRVMPLAANSPIQFQVQWSGTDAGGSGIAHYDVFVSTNGSPFVPWLQHTPLSAAQFQADLGTACAFYSVATDNSGNRESAPALPDASTRVTVTNAPPQLDPVPVQFVNEGETWQQTLVASDPDAPPGTLAFYPGTHVPPGVVLDAASGLMTWITGEGNGPGTNVFSVVVRDQGIPQKSATGMVTVVVREVNTRPVLPAIPDYTISEGRLLSVTNRATDADLPANRLSYSLVAPPTGATIGASDGIFRWRPSETQGPSTNRVTVVATDDGLGSLAATQSFTVLVRDTQPDFSVSVGSTDLYTGENGSVPITLDSSLDLTHLTFFVDAPADRVTNLALGGGSPEVISATLAPRGTNRSLLQFDLDALQAPGGQRALAQFEFLAVPGRSSALVPLRASGLTATRLDGIEITNGATHDGRLILVGDEPLLTIGVNPGPELTLYGKPAVPYRLQVRTNLGLTTPWADMAEVRLSGRSGVFPSVGTNGPAALFRVLEGPAGGAAVYFLGAGGSEQTFRLFGHPGSNYVFETTPSLNMPRTWTPVLEYTLTNVWQNVRWTNAVEPSRFFRTRQR